MKTLQKHIGNTIVVVLVIALATLAAMTAAPVGAEQSTVYDRHEKPAPAAARSQDNPANTPGKPLNPAISTDPRRSDDVTLTWSAPASDGGSVVTSYVVQWKSGDEAYDAEREAQADNTSYTFTALTHATEYTFRVMATNEHGNGIPSRRSDTPA